MTDKAIRQKIQNAMEHSLSGLTDDPLLAVRVLRRANEHKGEEKMIKKLSGGLALALVLALVLATAALALTNWDQLKGYFETVRDMEAEGELARWSDEDKIKLLRAMAEAGLITETDERAREALDETLPAAQRAEAAEAVIAARYGADYFDSHTVEELEYPLSTRTQEEQSAYALWSEDYNARWNGARQRPLTESRVYLATLNNLTEIGDFPRELLRDVTVTGAWDEKGTVYTATASIDKNVYYASKTSADQYSLFDIGCGGFAQGDALCFRFYLDEYGAFLGVDGINPESRAEITLDEALPIAVKALKVRLSVAQDTLDALTLRANYAEGDEYVLSEGRFRAICGFTWYAGSEPRYTVDIDAQTGRVIKALDWVESEAMSAKEKAWMDELRALLQKAGVNDTLVNAQGAYIWGWTLAEKAAWSEKARPIVLQYLAAHEEFFQYLEDLPAKRYLQKTWPNLIALTQYAYGVPDAQAIPQAKAFAIAREEALKAGAKQTYVDDNQGHILYYDVTNPARPLWKVLVSTLFGDGDHAHPSDPTAAWGYFVIMDARTGEVLSVTERTVNTDIRQIV